MFLPPGSSPADESSFSNDTERDDIRQAHPVTSYAPIGSIYQAQEGQYPRLKRLAKWLCYALTVIIFTWIFVTQFRRLDEERENSLINYESVRKFDEYLREFKKGYGDKNSDMYKRRKEAFMLNYRKHFHQAGTSSMKLNRFADWFDDEWENTMSLRTSRPDDAEAVVYSQEEYDRMNSNSD